MKHLRKATALVWLLLAAPAAAAPTVTEFDLPTANSEAQDNRMTLTAKDAAVNVSVPDRTRFRLLPAVQSRR